MCIRNFWREPSHMYMYNSETAAGIGKREVRRECRRKGERDEEGRGIRGEEGR